MLSFNCKSSLAADSIQFSVPRVVPNAQVVCFLPILQSVLAFCMCSLAMCRSSHSPPLGVLTESWLGVCDGEAWVALGVPVSHLEGSSCKLPWAVCCQIFLMEWGKWLVRLILLLLLLNSETGVLCSQHFPMSQICI